MSLKDRKILLGVTGGIAAYKAADLCSRLRNLGARVRVVMTPSATRFVAPLTFETLSGKPVYRDMFEREGNFDIGHIACAQWGDLLLVAPATANSIARFAHGLSEEPVSALFLTFQGPVYVAPAMNTRMYDNPATRQNIETLKARGVRVIAPESGRLACGEEGHGRLAPVEQLVEIVEQHFQRSKSLEGRRILITAGPTREFLDPIRFISNLSSGKMGLALAEAASERGARVTMVMGPCAVAAPSAVKVVEVSTAREMLSAVKRRARRQDVFIFAAAVADYRSESQVARKLKRKTEQMDLTLVRNPDIAGEISRARRFGQIAVGFAAESEDLEKNAREKLASKGLDLIVANSITGPENALGADASRAILLDKSNRVTRLARQSKRATAEAILDRIEQWLKKG